VTIPARVVSARGGDVEGLFEIAVEFSRSAAGLWGSAYKG
jgi:hypothetical protein